MNPRIRRHYANVPGGGGGILVISGGIGVPIGIGGTGPGAAGIYGSFSGSAGNGNCGVLGQLP